MKTKQRNPIRELNAYAEKEGRAAKKALNKHYEKKHDKKLQRALRTNNVQELINIEDDGY